MSGHKIQDYQGKFSVSGIYKWIKDNALKKIKTIQFHKITIKSKWMD